MHKKLLCALGTLLLLAGCGYTHKPLKPIKKEKAHFVQTKDNIELRLRVLTHAQCKKQLAGIPRYTQKFGKTTVIQCTIINNGQLPVTFSPAQTTIKLLTQLQAYEVLKGHGGRAFIGGVSGALATIACLPVLVTVCPSLTPSITTLVECIAIGFPFLPIVVLALTVWGGARIGRAIEKHTNRHVFTEIEGKVHTLFTVNPGKIYKTIVLTHDNTAHFAFAFTREKQEPVLFNVTLNKPDQAR